MDIQSTELFVGKKKKKKAPSLVCVFCFLSFSSITVDDAERGGSGRKDARYDPEDEHNHVNGDRPLGKPFGEHDQVEQRWEHEAPQGDRKGPQKRHNHPKIRHTRRAHPGEAYKRHTKAVPQPRRKFLALPGYVSLGSGAEAVDRRLREAWYGRSAFYRAVTTVAHRGR